MGICSGILILLLLLLLLLFLLWRRNRKQRNLEAPEAFLLGGRRPSDSTHTLDATNSVNASRLSSINNLPLAIQLHPDEKRPTTIWTTSNESSNVTGNTSNSLYIQYSNDGRRSESDNGVVAETGRGGSSGQSGDGNRLGNGSWTSQTSLSNSRPQSRSSPHLRISGISERSSNEAGSEMSYSEVPPPPPYSSSNDNVFSIYSNPPISIHHTRPG